VSRRVVAALAAAAILAAGCSGGSSGHHAGRDTTATAVAPVATQPTVARPPRVLVLGDSNLFQSGPEVDAALRAVGVVPTLLGVPSAGLKDLDNFWFTSTRVPALIAADPDLVIVGLGTNDAIDPKNRQQFPARLDRMMRALGKRPVIWITHVNDRPGAPASAGRAINADIRDAVRRWPNLSVLDFATTIAGDPAILQADGLHFSPGGMRIYAQKIAAAAARRLGLSGLD
jgi:lysophospholipase L1-like esterase